MFVDLGRADDLQDWDLKEGDQIAVSGLKTHVGDKTVLLAQSVKSGNNSTKIDRQRQKIEGQVASTHKTKIRGRQHLIAMLKPNGQQDDKLAVDLGPADKLKVEVKEGTKLTFRGVPVKVNNRKLMMAQAVQDQGEWKQIDRRKKSEQT